MALTYDWKVKVGGDFVSAPIAPSTITALETVRSEFPNAESITVTLHGGELTGQLTKVPVTYKRFLRFGA